MAKTLFKSLSYELSQLIGEIDLGKLALPELQRPFVWSKADVRDLMDSMYRGFPVGYLMLWNAADVDSRVIGPTGKQHTPTEFIIDGQQRLTGLYAVMKGEEVTFKDFSRGRIRIAFRPRDGRFDVTDAAIERDLSSSPTSALSGLGTCSMSSQRSSTACARRAPRRLMTEAKRNYARARASARARRLPVLGCADRPRS